MTGDSAIGDLNNARQIIHGVREGLIELGGLKDAERLIVWAIRKVAHRKIFLDDDPRRFTNAHRTEGWQQVFSGDVMIELLKFIGLESVSHISLDHDLGDDVATGYDVIKYIEERVVVHGDPMPDISIHSANPVGRENIERALNSIYRHLYSIEPQNGSTSRAG